MPEPRAFHLPMKIFGAGFEPAAGGRQAAFVWEWPAGLTTRPTLLWLSTGLPCIWLEQWAVNPPPPVGVFCKGVYPL